MRKRFFIFRFRQIRSQKSTDSFGIHTIKKDDNQRHEKKFLEESKSPLGRREEHTQQKIEGNFSNLELMANGQYSQNRP